MTTSCSSCRREKSPDAHGFTSHAGCTTAALLSRGAATTWMTCALQTINRNASRSKRTRMPSGSRVTCVWAHAANGINVDRMQMARGRRCENLLSKHLSLPIRWLSKPFSAAEISVKSKGLVVSTPDRIARCMPQSPPLQLLERAPPLVLIHFRGIEIFLVLQPEIEPVDIALVN